ncbi:MAG: DUF3820 family protein [Nonlabens sp.]
MFDKAALEELAFYKMPFGKFKGSYLSELPESYLVWFKRNGFPENKLGRMMESVYEIKINGLEDVLRKIRRL